MRKRAAVLVVISLLVPAARAAGEPQASAYARLRSIVNRSPAPEYRRAGSAGMANVADFLAADLAGAAYEVVRQDVAYPSRWVIDYASPPSLRTEDGRTFKTEGAFGSSGAVSCTVKALSDVAPGDCGLIPFADASPEWKNSPFTQIGADLDAIVAKGGAGAVFQGDVRRDLVFAVRASRGIPAVVTVADASEIVGQRVTFAAFGHSEAATLHNVIGIRRPPHGSTKYVMLLAHADAWFQGASDNGTGAAAILRAAEMLEDVPLETGVIVAEMDGEEVGLLGSHALFDAMTSDAGFAGIHLGDLKAIVNLDASSARASDVQSAVNGMARQDAPLFSWRAMVFSEQGGLLSPFLARMAAHQVLGLPMNAAVWQPFATGSINGGYRSDVQWFANAGVPFVWPVAGYPEYHTDGDDMRAVDAVDLENVTLGAVDLVKDIAALPVGNA